MPLYEYRCKDCGEEFEKQLRFAEADALPVCPKCSSARTQKKLSRVMSFVASGAAGGASSSAGSSCGSNGYFT
jgi:putative FmdB family regulatory protein